MGIRTGGASCRVRYTRAEVVAVIAPPLLWLLRLWFAFAGMTMTTEIKCANCPTTVHRVFGPDDDATAPWRCPECDSNEDEIPIEDDSFGSEKQIREADLFNGEQPDAPYIRFLEQEGLLDDSFLDDPKSEPVLVPVLVDDAVWFEEHAGKPTKAEITFTEKRLAKHGLSENIIHTQQDIQPVIVPVIEGTEFQGGIQRHQFERRMDGESLQAAARHCANPSELGTIHKVRTRKYERQVPLWALDDKKLGAVLRKVFPRLDNDDTQRESAGRWLRIVYLFFRANAWAKAIAISLGCSVRAVESVIRRAREVGMRCFRPRVVPPSFVTGTIGAAKN
jgi:DNA-directed RNA polymerase subunit RPC12/RpoP